MKYRFSYHRQLWLCLLPYLIGTGVLVIVPALVTVGIAFTEYNAVQPPAWVGLANFGRLLTSPLVRQVLQNTFIFLGLAVPLRLLGSLVLALLLNTEEGGFGLYRAALYLPTVIPESAYALIWLWILNPLTGPLNLLLGQLELPTPAWLVGPVTARLSIVLLSVFQIGEGMVVTLAGLQSIPRALYEVARVDGATRWQCFWRITMPLLMPWLLLLMFRDLLVSLQNTFTSTFVLTYGGPYYATTFVPLLIYELAFDFWDFGLAAAVLVFAYLLIIAAAVGVLNILDLRGGADAF
ncbi:MAG: sugar ABC transporter permease [Anaerolineae bacterium]|nr:sugar ABC transporter permease [Anaerolineae bacterium]